MSCVCGFGEGCNKLYRVIRRNSYPPSLSKSLLGENNLEGVKSVQFGINHDGDVKDYVALVTELGVGVIKETGLFLHSSGIIKCHIYPTSKKLGMEKRKDKVHKCKRSLNV